ncbi:MAG: phosphoribosylanthranilate isomerase [Oscillospiraceae bacterium]|nr:phosphoribosylanthranilate isomerase [Oscillospiraceae bacterium]
MSVKIKLCGMFREQDIDYVNEALPDYIGFIVMFPKSHRNIGFETALRLRSRLDPRIKSVAVSVNAPLEEFAEYVKSGAADILQCHGSEDGEYIARLRELTGAPIIKAVRVTAQSDIERAQTLGADFLLTDSGTGSGKLFDHSLIDPVKINRPFFLAGGLTPENLAETAKRVRPYGVDLSSGIETDMVKDREKILAAVREVRRVE